MVLASIVTIMIDAGSRRQFCLDRSLVIIARRSLAIIQSVAYRNRLTVLAGGLDSGNWLDLPLSECWSICLDVSSFGGQSAGFRFDNGEPGNGIVFGENFVMDNFTFEFIPEPSPFLLAALGGASLAALLRRKRA
ncbi:MAG: hypothetical protein ABSD58_12585 [Verrucomicrobiia bacterium]